MLSTACTFGKITRDMHWSICSCHFCGQWIRLTLTQKITSCGWLSDIPGLLLCSSCFQTLVSLKIMAVLKLVKGSAGSPVKDNQYTLKGALIQTQGKSRSDSSLRCCRCVLMAHKVVQFRPCSSFSGLVKDAPDVSSRCQVCQQGVVWALGMLIVIEATLSFTY